MTAELLDEAPDDVETIVISWLKDLYPPGHVANTRRSGGPLPFILVSHLDSTEIVEESSADALVSVHILTHKSAGELSSRDEANKAHRRILLMARYLDDPNFSIDFVEVAKSPKREPYGDDQILRRIGRYTIGLSYSKVQ